MASPSQTRFTEFMGDAQPPDADLVLGRVGALLLDAGMSVTDVRDAVDDVRRATASDVRVGVLPQLMIVTRRSTGAATMVPAGDSELSFRQAGRAGRLVRELRDRAIPLAAANARIEEIRAAAAGHPVARSLFGGVLSGGGLAVLFRCPWWAILLSLAIGGLVGLLLALLQQVRGAAALAPFVASLLSTSLLGLAATRLDLGPVPLLAICAPIAVLVPGAVITNGLLELTATDILTGSARLVYGLVVLAFMAAGIAAGAALTGLHLDVDSAALVGQVASLVTDATGWGALPPLWVSWVGIVVLGIGVGFIFGVRPGVDRGDRGGDGAHLLVADLAHALAGRQRGDRGDLLRGAAAGAHPGEAHRRRPDHGVVPAGLPAAGARFGGPGGAGRRRRRGVDVGDGDLRQPVHRHQARLGARRPAALTVVLRAAPRSPAPRP